MKQEIFEGLNPAQNEAVREIYGPSLIVAGAGSGKTKVLTCRIANILAQGCRPSKVLALTFTKKAANEMKERISTLVGGDKARWIWMGTFHSIFIRFLRGNAELLGYPEQFTIYDQSDSRSAIRLCIKELQLDDKTYNPNYVQSRISTAKNNLITPAAYRSNQEIMMNDLECKRGRICDIYDLYAQKCKTAGAMDFDDILLNTNILFKKHPNALQMIREQFSYILVDEYQDTNYAQYLILKKLAEEHKNICVVGDDFQSIYGFRGARIENILNFKRDYPDAKEFKLEQNYRSTRTIVEAANSLIFKNEHRLEKKCFSMAEEGEKVAVIKAYTEQEEAYKISTSIVDRIYKEKAQYDEFAILYRTNAQSRVLEEALRKRNLPYRVYAGHSFYDRAEVKDMLAYFRLVVNPKDDEALRRVINVPARGIGDTSLSRLSEAAKNNGTSIYEALFLPNETLFATGMKEAALIKMRGFATIIEEIHQKSTTTDAYRIAVEIGNASGYLESLRKDTSVEGMSKYDNIQELFNSVKEHSEKEADFMDGEEGENESYISQDKIVTISDYLENIALLSEVEKEDEEGETANRITLMTIHSAKGLEYPYVYITGMEEGLFPSEGNSGRIENIEEERRLCYVAITRAKKCVTMSYAKSRMKWGQHSVNRPSRFLKEIDKHYLDSAVDDSDELGILTSYNDGDYHNPNRYGRRPSAGGVAAPSRNSSASTRVIPSTRSTISTRPTPSAPAASHTPSENFTPSPIEKLAQGQRVEHARFGYGTIITLDNSTYDKKAIVAFDSSGNKTLLLKYAKLRIIE